MTGRIEAVFRTKGGTTKCYDGVWWIYTGFLYLSRTTRSVAVSALLFRMFSRFWIFCSSSDGSHFPFRIEAVRPRMRGLHELPSNSCRERGKLGHSQFYGATICHRCKRRKLFPLRRQFSPSLSHSTGGLWWPGDNHQKPPGWFSTTVKSCASEHVGIRGKSWPAPVWDKGENDKW